MIYKTLSITLTALLLITRIACAQVNNNFKQVSLGIGYGIDFGGLGLKVLYLPDTAICLFFGAGSDFIGIAYNAGAYYRIAPQTKVSPFIGAMYGYNAFINIDDAAGYNKTYYGVSFLAGVEPMHRNNRNYFTFEIIIPVRSEQFNNDWNSLQNIPGFVVTSEPSPILFSFGFNFGL